MNFDNLMHYDLITGLYKFMPFPFDVALLNLTYIT